MQRMAVFTLFDGRYFSTDVSASASLVFHLHGCRRDAVAGDLCSMAMLLARCLTLVFTTVTVSLCILLHYWPKCPAQTTVVA